MTALYINSNATRYVHTYDTDITLAQQFHQRLPGYNSTPLVFLSAPELGVKAVFVKNESSRMNLPAYKILGASWGTFRAIVARTNIPLESTLEEVSVAAQKLGIKLFAATAGNHGRAVARMAKILGISAKIFLGNKPDEQVVRNIESEGAQVIVIEGTYDDAVEEAAKEANGVEGGMLIQDVAYAGSEEVPAWIVEGYSTLLQEIEQQLDQQGLKATHIIPPVGAGSLGHAVVAHSKSNNRNIKVITVEPETAACLNHNLKQGKHETIPTTKTIMDGMHCGTVSSTSWPVLQQGVDVSVVITDKECHEAIGYLHKNNINAGPCGAASLAALWKVAATPNDRNAAGLDENSVVVLLSTEGERYYKIPE